MKNNYYLVLLFILTGLTAQAQWSSNPGDNLKLTGLTGEQVIPKIRLAPNGDYYLGYYSLESGNYNVRLQRLDNQGNKLWDSEGLLISSHPSMTWLTDWDMAVDHENHVVMTWQDIRVGGNNNIVAYRIAPDGTFVWGPDGMMLSNNTAFNVTPTIAITSANNAVIAWMADNNLIRQKISPAGVKLWGENGITMSSSTIRYMWPQLMPVGDDDVLMKYYEDTGVAWAPTRHVYLQRFNASGQGVWTNPTVVSNAGNITAWTQILPMESDGNGGCIIAWHDYRLSGTISSGWVQHINSSGQPQFQANGLKIAETDDMNKFYLQLAKPANDQNIYVLWNEVNGDQNAYGIYAQKISPAGERMWTDFGKVIIPVSSQAVLPDYLLPLDNDIVLVYEHYFDGLSTSIRAIRLDAVGNTVWNPAEVMISSVQSSKVHLDKADFDGDQWVFAWEDDRSGDVDLFGQNLLPSGQLGIVGATGILDLVVTVEGDMIPPGELNVQIGSESYQLDEQGHLSLELPVGTYVVTVSHAYTGSSSLEVTLTEGSATSVSFDLLLIRTDLIVQAIDQDGNLVFGDINVSITGPETTYTGILFEGVLIFTNIPFGHYTGSAWIDPDYPVEADTIVDINNQNLIFHMIVGGIEEQGGIGNLTISPNPVVSSARLSFTSRFNGTATLYVFDAAGLTVGRETMVIQQGVNQWNLERLINLPELSKGAYTLGISINNNKLVKVKMIVLKE